MSGLYYDYVYTGTGCRSSCCVKMAPFVRSAFFHLGGGVTPGKNSAIIKRKNTHRHCSHAKAELPKDLKPTIFNQLCGH